MGPSKGMGSYSSFSVCYPWYGKSTETGFKSRVIFRVCGLGAHRKACISCEQNRWLREHLCHKILTCFILESTSGQESLDV